jgi:hypothetical protein
MKRGDEKCYCEYGLRRGDVNVFGDKAQRKLDENLPFRRREEVRK